MLWMPLAIFAIFIEVLSLPEEEKIGSQRMHFNLLKRKKQQELLGANSCIVYKKN